MNKKVVRRLKKIAEQLPPIPERKPDVTTGKEMIDRGVKEDKDGKPIKETRNVDRIKNGRKITTKEDVVYVGWKPGTVNHLRRLKEVYNKDGDKGVSVYSGEATRLFARLQKELRDKQKQKETEKVI